MRRLLANWWVITSAAAVIVAACLAIALPIFVHPLRPLGVRLVLVLLVALAWTVAALIRVLRGRRASEALAAEIAPERAAPEAQVLSRRFREALAALQQAAGGRRDYLYSRPWYMIIGPPGAGKTTALVNSGLRFPYSDTALKGVAGTRNLDFWFSDQAVLVDTAGRYTTQDSDVAADAGAWKSFLGLLRRHRPLQPINGVIVALALDELVRADRQQIDRHATAVRLRLAELRSVLQVAVPVYVLLTKADLLAGFVEYFDDLDVEGRRAVLGATLARGDRLDAAALANAYDVMQQSIADRMARRLQDELDPRRRSLILGFPGQLAAARARVLRFVDTAFLDEDVRTGELRGFYLTSGVQGGAPLDRLLSDVASVYDQAPVPMGRGRAYFLNRLLNEVVIPEAGLAQGTTASRGQRVAMVSIAAGAIAIVAGVVAALWTVSLVANLRLQSSIAETAQKGRAVLAREGLDLAAFPAMADFDQVAPAIEALEPLRREAQASPWYMHMGLYQGSLARNAETTYLDIVQRILGTRELLEMETRLRSPTASSDLYAALKAYLMLASHLRGERGRYQQTAVDQWIEADWRGSAMSGDRGALAARLKPALQALLDDQGGVTAIATPEDSGVVDQARQTLQHQAPAERAYALLRSLPNGAPSWRSTLRPYQARAFADPDLIQSLVVEGLYTHAGWELYQRELPGLAENMRREAWVIYPDGAPPVASDDIMRGVADLYARDYIAQWRKVLEALQPGRYFEDKDALNALGTPPSPLDTLLSQVKANTTLGDPSRSDAAGQISSAFSQLGQFDVPAFVKAVQAVAAAQAAAAGPGSPSAGGGDAGQAQLRSAEGALQTIPHPPMLDGFVDATAKGGVQAVVGADQAGIAGAYAPVVAQCRALVNGHYPFNRARPDASLQEMQSVFGGGGAFDVLLHGQPGGLLDKTAPVWRWRAGDPVADRLNPASAQALQLASQIRDLLSSGVQLDVELDTANRLAAAPRLAIGGETLPFDTLHPRHKLGWSAQQQAVEEASLTLGPTPGATLSAEGPWALFHLVDKADTVTSSAPRTVLALFRRGEAYATLKITVDTPFNPLRRDNIWSFRCPPTL